MLLPTTSAVFEIWFAGEGGGVSCYGVCFSHQPWLLLWCELRWVGARMEIVDISVPADLSYGTFLGRCERFCLIRRHYKDILIV